MDNNRPLGYEFKKMNNQIMRHLHQRLSAAGFDEVTIVHGWIMGYVYDHGDRIVCQKDIENDFGVAKSTVTNILKLMEKKGYLTRTTDKKDARHKNIALTELGVRVHLDTIKIIDRLHEDMEKGITAEERDTFFAITKKIRDNMEEKND